MNVLLMDRIF